MSIEMASYRVQLEDGRAAEIVDEWREPKIFDGRNYVGRFTRDQWRGADLGRTRSGLWVILPDSSYQGERPRPYEIDADRAAGWFAACDLDIPEELGEQIV